MYVYILHTRTAEKLLGSAGLRGAVVENPENFEIFRLLLRKSIENHGFPLKSVENVVFPLKSVENVVFFTAMRFKSARPL